MSWGHHDFSSNDSYSHSSSDSSHHTSYDNHHHTYDDTHYSHDPATQDSSHHNHHNHHHHHDTNTALFALTAGAFLASSNRQNQTIYDDSSSSGDTQSRPTYHQQEQQRKKQDKLQQKIITQHRALINKLQKLKKDATNTYKHFSKGISQLPPLNSSDRLLPRQNNVDLLGWVVGETVFSTEEKIALLNQLFGKGYLPLSIFNAKWAIDRMCTDAGWSHFILHHYKILLNTQNYALDPANKSALWQYLLLHPELDDTKSLIMVVYQALQNKNITEETFVLFIHAIINTQATKEDVVQKYDSIKLELGGTELTAYFDDLQKMAKNRILALELTAATKEQKQNDPTTSVKKSDSLLALHRSGFFGSTTSWDIHQKILKGDAKSLKKAAVMHQKEEDKLTKSLTQKFLR